MVPRFLHLKTLLIGTRGEQSILKLMLRTNFLKTVLSVFMLSLCMVGFYSCGSDDGPEDETPGDEKSIIGKWEVKNSGGEYGSFEFTGDKKYIIEQHVTKTRADNYIIIIFGDYNTINSEGNTYTLDLKQFGTITITIDNGNAEITVNGETYNTSKAKEVETTDKTKLLCHTWNVKSEDDEGLIAQGTMTFTTSGTYFMAVNNVENVETNYDNGTWEWNDTNTLYVSYISYWESDNGGENSSGTEIGYDNWNIVKLTDKEFLMEFDDEGDIVRVIGTR